MNKNYIIGALCLVVVGLLIAYLIRPAPTPILIGKLTTEQEAELRANLATLESQNDSLKTELGKSEAKDSVQQQSHKRAVQTFRNVIARLEKDPEVIVIRDSVPKIDSLLKAKDSVIVHHEIRIEEMEHSQQVTKDINEKLVSNFESRMASTEQLLQDKTAEVGELQQDNKKLKRRLFWTRVGGIVILGGVVALSL